MRQRVRYAYDGLSGVDRNEFKIDFLLGDVSIFFSIELLNCSIFFYYILWVL